MSYCRFGNADAYIFEHVGGFWQCCACALLAEQGAEEFASADFDTREDLLSHIDKHRKAGHHIPEDVDERLKEEIADEARNSLQ